MARYSRHGGFFLLLQALRHVSLATLLYHPCQLSSPSQLRCEGVPKATRVQDKVMNLRKFFEVARLLFLENQPVLGIARRQLSTTEKSDYAFIAWVQKAKLDARNVSTSPINLGALAKSIPDIRRMTTMDPSDFCPKLIE